MIGRTNKISKFIEEMKKLNVDIMRLYAITENQLIRLLKKNGQKIEEILIIPRQGEKLKISDFPKMESVFEREMVNGVYICVPKIKEEYKWVFTDKCLAVTKLDGTCCCAVVEEGKIIRLMNRMNIIDIWKSSKHFYDGFKHAVDSNVFIPEQYISFEQVWGELIGERINGNPYNLTGHRWLPFEHLKEKYSFKFWSDIVKDCEGKSDEEIFNITSKTFEGLWCIYKRQLGIKGEVNKDVGFEGLAGEGIVFYNKDTGQMCKLRRDMFEWYYNRNPNIRDINPKEMFFDTSLMNKKLEKVVEESLGLDEVKEFKKLGEKS